MWHADVLANSRPETVVVECLGRDWRLRFTTASQWLGAVGFDPTTLSGVFPGGLHDDDLDAFWEASAGLSHTGGWSDTARMALAFGSGRDWWWSVNMAHKVLPMWSYINGLLLLEGIDTRNMLFADWLDACFMLLWRSGDEDHRKALEIELALPPKGVKAAIPAKATKQMVAAFAAD